VDTYCWLALSMAGCRVAARSLCVCRLWAVTRTASRLSFSDESALEVCIHDDFTVFPLQILFPFYGTYSHKIYDMFSSQNYYEGLNPIIK